MLSSSDNLYDTRYVTPDRRQSALRWLVQETDGGHGARDLAAAAARVYEKLTASLSPIVGQAGIHALLSRSIHLAAAEHASLAGAARADPASQAASLQARLQTLDPEEITETAVALFATFTGLLASFIGDTLTSRLLQDAWPEIPFGESSAEETRE
jgi:hypothetical protein